MPRRNGNAELPKESLLKIDKDCHASSSLNGEYVQTIMDTCRKHTVKVLWVKSTRTNHGRHFYIKIEPSIGAEATNDLQYLLGDDAKRYAFNEARIKSGLQGWNKLFERPGAKLRTAYQRNWGRCARYATLTSSSKVVG